MQAILESLDSLSLLMSAFQKINYQISRFHNIVQANLNTRTDATNNFNLQLIQSLITDANQLIINGINETNTTQNGIENLLSQLDRIEAHIAHSIDNLPEISIFKSIIQNDSATC